MDDKRTMPDDVEMDDYFRTCIEIDPVQIEAVSMQLPAGFAYWNEKYAQAMRAELLAAHELSILRDQLRLMVRARLEAVKEKVTESMVEAKVSEDESYRSAKLAAIEAEAEAVRLKGRLEAIRMARDMVMQIGAQIRAEKAGDPQVRSQAAGARVVREQAW